MKKQIILLASLGLVVQMNTGAGALQKQAEKSVQPQKAVVSDKKIEVSKSNAHVKNINDLGDFSTLNIKFVESFDAMRQCKQGEVAGKALEDKREKLSKAIQEDELKLGKAVQEFQSKASVLSESAREEKEKNLRKMKTEYEAKVQESEYDLKLAMQKTTEELGADIQNAVKTLAVREKIDAVVDTVTGRVLYVADNLNITSSVITEMNKDYEVKLAKNTKTKTDTTLASNTTAAVKTQA